MPPRKRFWDCHGKDAKGQPCGYMVPTGKIACDACGHQPPLHISCPGKTCAGKGAGKADAAGGGKSSGKGKDKSSGNDDAAKLKAALSARAAAEAKIKDGAKANAALLAELKKLKAAGNSPPQHGPSIEADAMEQDGCDLETTALDEAVVQARDELKQMQGFTTFHRSLITDFEAKLASAQGRLDDALVARRAANPLKKQLETAEAHQKRSGKKLADAKASLETKRKELADAQLAIERQQAAVAEAEAVVAKVDAEVAQLAARFALERNAAPPAKSAQPEQVLPGAGWLRAEEAEQISNQLLQKKEDELRAVYEQQCQQQLQELVAKFQQQHAAADEDDVQSTPDSDAAEPVRKEKEKRRRGLREAAVAELSTKVKQIGLKKQKPSGVG